MDISSDTVTRVFSQLDYSETSKNRLREFVAQKNPTAVSAL
jgi:hypothetical protein